MNKSPLDAGIPMLTEIIPGQENPVVLKAPTSSIAVPPRTSPAITPPIRPVPTPTSLTSANVDISEEKWVQLEADLHERVLNNVLERIDFVLEQRVRDSLADVLQMAVEELAKDIKGGLHHTIKDVVTRAISQEISKSRSLKK